jgi:hypothetical protein
VLAVLYLMQQGVAVTTIEAATMINTGQLHRWKKAFLTMYAGIIKKHGDVAKTKGGRPVKESVNAVHTLPTEAGWDFRTAIP